VDTTFILGKHKFPVPIIAASMDGVVDVKFAIAMGKLGGIAVLNLDGIQTRYDNPDTILEQISKATPKKRPSLFKASMMRRNSPLKTN